MEKVNYRITLDVQKPGVQKILRGMFAGEALSRRIVISLVAGSSVCNMDQNTTAMMYVTKPNGVTNYNACTIEDNLIYYDILQDNLNVEGMSQMQLKILSGDSILYAPMFNVEIQRNLTSDEQAEETPTFTALEKALAQATEVYNTRLVSIEVEEDLTFVATFGDGTTYESYAIKNAIADIDEAEAERTAAEHERVEAFSKMEYAEQERSAEEAERKSAEEERRTAEAARVAAERERSEAYSKMEGYDDAEAERVSAESVRVTAEAERVSAEQERASAFRGYADKESERVIAETNRVLAEQNRVAAEENRAEAFGTMQDDIQKLLDMQGLVTESEKTRWNNKADGLSYEGNKLSLMSGDTVLETVTVEGGSGSADLSDCVLLDGSNGATNTVKDVNDFHTGIGLFCAENGILNMPSTGWWLIVSGGADGTRTQLGYHLFGHNTPRRRYCAAGTWGEWEPLNKDYLLKTGKAADSSALDGHGSEYFMPIECYSPKSYRGTTTEEINQILNNLHTNTVGDNKVYTAKISFAEAHPILGGNSRFIIGHKVNSTYGWQMAISYSNANAQKILFRQLINSDTWGEWDSNAFVSDLANYLPKDGTAQNASKLDGHEAEYFFPKSGGEVQSTAVSPIRVNNTGGNAKTLFGFLNNGVLQGYLGFKGVEKPFYQNTTGGEYDLLHTGNMTSHVLPLTGGYARGAIGVNKADNTEATVRAGNTLGIIELLVSSSGRRGLYDRTNGAWLCDITADGTNTFNGTASGNLPLSGGILAGNLYFKKADNGQGIVYKDHSASSDYGMVLRDDDASGKSVRMLMSASSNGIRFRDTDGVYNDILHTGNSSKTVIVSSDPGVGASTSYANGTLIFVKE